MNGTNALAMNSLSPELRRRIATGIVGAAFVVLVIVYCGMFGIFFLATLLSLMAMNEFAHITLSLPDREEKRYVLLFTTWLIAMGTFFLAHSEYELLVLSFLGFFAYYLATARHHPNTLLEHFRELMFSIFGLLYLGLLPTYLPKIHGFSNGVHWTILFLLVNWSVDTGAYFAGKRFGKTKLYPGISPKKTREGGIGGLAVAFAMTLAYRFIFFRTMPWGAVFAVPILVGTVAQVGDLCESFLKRAYSVKDSGQILPGHGGFLDRFDGVVFSLPVMYACIRVFG